jgi:predicted DsbA family dithiol-disulfide isomerase
MPAKRPYSPNRETPERPWQARDISSAPAVIINVRARVFGGQTADAFDSVSAFRASGGPHRAEVAVVC